MTRITARKRGPTAKARAAKAAKDARYAKTIRDQVDERDGPCRVFTDLALLGVSFQSRGLSGCEGVQEWAHLWDKKRHATRGLPPEERHSTVWTVMLCTKHHLEYDTEHTLAILGTDANQGLEFRRI